MKYITVPINKEAMIRLDYDQNIEGDLVEIIVTDEEVLSLWRRGLFAKLNSQLDILIDDYEWEEVTDYRKLLKMKEIIKANNTDYLTEKILHLVELAIEYKTGIFFCFQGNGNVSDMLLKLQQPTNQYNIKASSMVVNQEKVGVRDKLVAIKRIWRSSCK